MRDHLVIIMWEKGITTKPQLYLLKKYMIFLKLGLSGNYEKTQCCAFKYEDFLLNPLYLWGKCFGATRPSCKKN